MAEPKFKIGQFVYRKQDLACYDFEEGSNFSKPNPSLILDILQETCYAGTQIHYGLRGYDPRTGQSVIARFIEIELTDKFEKQI